MECEKAKKLLSFYLEDELSAQQRKEVESHLKSCPGCSELYSLLQQTKESLSSWPELEVRPELLDRLYSIPEKKKRFKFSFYFFLRPSLQPILAGVAILLMVISFYAFNPQRKQINHMINFRLHRSYSQLEKLYAKAESLTENLGAYKDEIIVSIHKNKLWGKNED